MKHRKMKWSLKGAETIARMIIDVAENTIEDLFLGEWRFQYSNIVIEGYSAAKTNIYTREDRNIKESSFKISDASWLKKI